MSEVLERVLQGEILIPLIIAGSIVTVSLAKIAGRTITGVAKERTRREIAAYIAEGSMSPDQGERLMKAERGDHWRD
jgi:hypothetical protein